MGQNLTVQPIYICIYSQSLLKCFCIMHNKLNVIPCTFWQYFVSLAFSGCFKKDISQLRHQSNRGSWCYGTCWTTSTGFISHILISTRKLCVSMDKYSSWNMYITVRNVSEYLSENISNQWICMYKLLSIFMYIIQCQYM